MIISHRHKFIFIHVWKTGGTSVTRALSPFVENQTPDGRFLNGLFEKKKPLSSDFDKHITSAELADKLDEKYFKNYFKFAFVRNPLSWEVSYYHYITQKPNNHPQKEIIRQLGSFENYIPWAAEHEMMKRSQRTFLHDENGNSLVDFVGKYEELEEGMNYVAKKLGLSGLELERHNTSKHGKYQDYYTAETAAIVMEAMKVDFELFGYQNDEEHGAHFDHAINPDFLSL